MAQPLATAKRIRTAETNFPLRAHPQEWRQRSVTLTVPFAIAASASTGLGIASFIASIPFDVKSVTMAVLMNQTISGSSYLSQLPVGFNVSGAALPVGFLSTGASNSMSLTGGVLGIREWNGFFGAGQAAMQEGNNDSVTFDFPRPQTIQGTQFTIDAYNTANADDTQGLWKDGAWAGTTPSGALRITFHRMD